MIKLYVNASCGPCTALQRALTRAGVDYESIDAQSVSEPIRAAWRAKGWSTPIVEHAGGSFSGYLPDQVQALIEMRQ